MRRKASENPKPQNRIPEIVTITLKGMEGGGEREKKSCENADEIQREVEGGGRQLLAGG